MGRRLLATCLFSLAAPAMAGAAPVTLVSFDTFSAWNGSLTFDAGAARGYQEVGGATVDRDANELIPLEYRDLGGYFETFNGPLNSLSVGPIDLYGDYQSDYSYGAGWLRMIAQWQNPDGTTGRGGFVVPTGPLAFTVLEKDLIHPGANMSDFPNNACVVLGRGTLDPELAAHLGVGPKVLGGEFCPYVYGISDDPTVVSRYGQIYSGASWLDIYAVPEPSAMTLAVVVALMTARRFRGDLRR